MKPKRSIFEYHAFDDAWDSVLRDWFTRQQTTPFVDLPRAVIVPNESTILYIKEYLLKNDIAFLGIRFFTPGTLRHYLLEVYNYSEALELRENLHLLMKVASRHFSANPVSDAAEVEPEQFVRLADLLEATGWSTEVIKNFHLKPLIEKYLEEQDRCGLTTAQKITNTLYTRSQTAPLFAFSDLLLFGFRSKQWSNYKMLLSAIQSSEKTTVCLLTQDSSRLIDQGWLGSWEEECGSSERIPAQFETPFSYLSYYYEDVSTPRDNIRPEQVPEIYIAEDIFSEAEVVVAKIASALVLEKVSRLGVVFANQTSPLAREVSRLLESEEIFHYNHIGYIGGTNPRQKLFECWVNWQKTPRLQGFLIFLDQLVNEGLLPFIQFDLLRKQAGRALQNTLTDELSVIISYLKCNKPDAASLALMDQWAPLPEEAFFSEYITLSQASLETIAWPKDIELIKKRAGILLDNLKSPIKKLDFLSWLCSVTKPLGRVANYFGKCSHSLVHLITEEEAILQGWSHLILAGLNQGEWPSEKPQILFLDDNQIADANQKSLVPGNQGEGHLTIKPGLSLFLSSNDQYASNKSNFITLLGLSSEKLILTAHLKDPKKSNDSLLSEYLERVYLISRSSLLDANSIQLIHQNTKQWIQPFKSRRFENPIQNEQVLSAYNKRREQNTPFDEYSFCFKDPQSDAFHLPAKAWEDILTAPERAWFSHILGTKKEDVLCGKSLFALAKGTWIHSWLNLDTHYAPKKIGTSEWIVRINTHAAKVLGAVEKSFTQINRAIPDIWKANWYEARRTAIALSNALSNISEQLYFFSEHTVPESNKGLSSKVLDIPLKGRIDLIAYPISNFDDKTHPLWIIDFKTGSSGALTENKLRKGVGLQLALYALAFKFIGFSDIDLSIVQPHSTLSKQIHLDDVLECSSLLDGINSIYRSGRLGVRESMKSRYGAESNFPLATLKIEGDIITRKWNVTHPCLTH